MDVDTIEPGVDFAEAIRRAVATCEVLLAVIGPHWLTATDKLSRPRLTDPDDLVRLEIETALARDVRVIPILVEGAAMPGRQDLPESLAGLAHRNALSIRHESFRDDAARLVTAIEGIVQTAAPARTETPGEAPTEGPQSVRGDLSRAAWVIADAECTVQSITDKSSKAWALARVAEALVAIDPGRAARVAADAERIAQSITSELTKALALADVAEALAARSP